MKPGKLLNKKIFVIITIVAVCVVLSFKIVSHSRDCKEKTTEPQNVALKKLYSEMNIGRFISYQLFEKAIFGYNKLNVKNKDILSIIDYSKPSTEDRFFVLDLKHKKMLFKTIVSHGKGSGENYATSFSNQDGSHKSSLGFYETEKTYQGENGYSLILNGLEKDINDNAKKRAIVIHGADYCNYDLIRQQGRIGRSFGCPALPKKLAEPIINTIKDGTLLFIYANDKEYLTKSLLMNNMTGQPHS